LGLGPPTIEVSGSEIFIQRAVFEHVIGGREDGGGNSADRFLRPASSAPSHELRVQVGGFGARGRPSALNEHGLQPGSSPAQASRPALAGTFVIAQSRLRKNTPLGTDREMPPRPPSRVRWWRRDCVAEHLGLEVRRETGKE
jgi:hypothetical protein